MMRGDRAVSLALSVLRRVEGFGGSTSRMQPAHLVKAGLQQFLGVERRAAGEQFVEQHAKAVDVAAGVDVESAQLAPARGSCRRACR